MIFGSIIIFSPIQDFPYSFLLNSAAEPDRQQNISFAPDIQASRLPKLALFGFVWLCFFAAPKQSNLYKPLSVLT
jgi:hypothetical protein